MTHDTDFELLAFFAADHAVAVEGKLYVNGGGWDRLSFLSFPQPYPIALAALLRVPFRAYHQDHVFKISLEDSDGRSLPLEIEGKFRIGAAPEMRVGDPTTLPIGVPANTAAIGAPGDYAFVFAVDGAELGRYRIRAVQLAGPGGGPSGPITRRGLEDPPAEPE